jgi:hypothetical protein
MWKKLGLVCDGTQNFSWAATHAALPVVDVRGSVARVYFSGRDAAGRSSIGVGEIDLSSPAPRMTIGPNPVLTLGALGAFDDSGVTSSCMVRSEGQTYLYYTGWARGVTVPFYFYVGLAISEDGEHFSRPSPAPVLDRNAVDPYLTASPWVLIENGVWRMWYVSAVKWELENGKPKHYYHIRYAESSDGAHWRRDGTVCIDFASAEEHAFARPCVLKDGEGCYRMWYSYRGERYRIGYAESADGIVWQRRDDCAGIEPSAAGWDAEMIEYPAVFDAAGRRYMLYNGNGYGRTGIGLAVLETD